MKSKLSSLTLKPTKRRSRIACRRSRRRRCRSTKTSGYEELSIAGSTRWSSAAAWAAPLCIGTHLATTRRDRHVDGCEWRNQGALSSSRLGRNKRADNSKIGSKHRCMRRSQLVNMSTYPHQHRQCNQRRCRSY
uniref:Uncharacterized protein n=1 Tax=Hyaloperonospora arabidopsidis (strain Emoy2) TaxID=559515 RepID=M4BI42_HYAAE